MISDRELLLEARHQTAEAAREQALIVFDGQRRYAVQASQGLTRLNAGALAALLAFVAATAGRVAPTDPSAFAEAIGASMAALVVGLAAASAIPFVGYMNYSAVGRHVNEYWDMDAIIRRGRTVPKGYSALAPFYRVAGIVLHITALGAFLYAGISALPALNLLFAPGAVVS